MFPVGVVSEPTMPMRTAATKAATATNVEKKVTSEKLANGVVRMAQEKKRQSQK